MDVLANTLEKNVSLISLKDFHEMTDADIVRLRDRANEWFEMDSIETEHMRRAVGMTRWHWPLEES